MKDLGKSVQWAPPPKVLIELVENMKMIHLRLVADHVIPCLKSSCCLTCIHCPTLVLFQSVQPFRACDTSLLLCCVLKRQQHLTTCAVATGRPAGKKTSGKASMVNVPFKVRNYAQYQQTILRSEISFSCT